MAFGLVALANSPAGAAGPYRVSCEAHGIVSFTPSLGTNSTQFQHTAHAQLANCQGLGSGGGAGTLSIGETYVQSGLRYQEPIAAGEGTCAASSSHGNAIITWTDGFTTVLGFDTNEADGALHFDGWVVGTIALPAVAPDIGSITVTSTRYPAPGDVPGLLSFLPQPPCGSGQGSSHAEVEGFLAFASGSVSNPLPRAN